MPGNGAYLIQFGRDMAARHAHGGDLFERFAQTPNLGVLGSHDLSLFISEFCFGHADHKALRPVMAYGFGLNTLIGR